MAARTRKGTKDNPWPAVVKNRIRTSMLINRLSDHVVGKVDLKPTQVTAALGLLKKTTPDLAAVQHTGDGGGPLKVELVSYANHPSAK